MTKRQNTRIPKFKVKINLEKLILEKLGDRKQRVFARNIDRRYGTINDMCNNESKQLPLDILALACEELNVQISDILELVENPDYPAN
ncbi:helix-turn-helix domain-containing protein [Brevibacillus laterosporus]|uniref:helix-turn-helix domain-containing protein n=1 Tax=Brevibacillus laterosporus TaxID=1465 RepID=UPI0035A73E17